MKKVLITGVSILLFVVIGICLIKDVEVDTEITKNKTKVGCVFIGSKADKSWGQSHYEAIMSVAKELNLEIICKENVAGDESCLDVINNLVYEGCKIIMCDSYSHSEWVIKAAEKYPDINFFHATGIEERKNLTTYFGRMYQVRYLSGIVAGLQTETDEIGYVAAFPIDEVIRGINAFTLGVKAVNPDAKVYVKWIESWNDDDKTRQVTNELLDAHKNIDVLGMHSDSLEPLKVAQERSIWSIGYHMDNSIDFKDTYLTSSVWTWEKFYRERLLECLQGKARGEHYWEGVESGIVALAPLTDNVKPGIQSKVNEALNKMLSGEFDVFYGPIVDTQGNVRIDSGESMTDDNMLNDFKWYVKGLVIDK